MILVDLMKEGLITAPRWLPENTMLLVQMGSEAYGCSTDNSDLDIYGFCVPRKEDVFPHLRGEIMGFGTQKQRFEVWQQHHVKSPSRQKEYDFSVFSIVRWFDLAMSNNPNMIDALFVPRRCVIHSTAISELVRENRKLFLHKGAFPRFRGYALSQLHKIDIKTNSQNPKRAAEIAKYGYDLKFAMHVVRLGLECEQILESGDLSLDRDREVYKSIRRGEWTLPQIKSWFTDKEKRLSDLYATSALPHSPDEQAIKHLLLKCLEHHYGSLSNAISRPDRTTELLNEIEALVARYR